MGVTKFTPSIKYHTENFEKTNRNVSSSIARNPDSSFLDPDSAREFSQNREYAEITIKSLAVKQK